MGRAYVVVEGHGECDAILSLLHALGKDLGLPTVIWARPERQNKLHTREGTHAICEALRSRGDCDRALLLRDAEDGRPCHEGPATTGWVAETKVPFPVAVVLFYREFETLFLPCIPAMAGRTASDGRVLIRADAEATSDPERYRDAKGWLSRLMPPGRRYRPTTDQLALTRMLDFDMLRAANLACFGTLERALRFVLTTSEPSVYPPAGVKAPLTKPPRVG